MFAKACLTLLVLAAAAAQEPPFADDAPRYSLEGLVINSVTGAPIPGALVHEFSNGNRAVRAGADGKFHFRGLPAGSVTLRAGKPGYFDPTEDQPAMPAQSVTVGPNADPVVLKLIPEGIIFGRITGQDGEPIQGLQVRAEARQVLNGRRTRVALGMATTDDEGRFRLANLRREKYFVSASLKNQGESEDVSLSARLVGYGTVFYPGATDSASAVAIDLTPGQHVEINFQMVRRQLYRVSGRVIGAPEPRNVALAVFDPDGQNIGQFAVDAATGRFTAEGLPGGACVLTAMSQSQDDTLYTASLTLQLDADVADVPLALSASTDVFATVRKETTRS
jgi:hypothetical protein